MHCDVPVNESSLTIPDPTVRAGSRDQREVATVAEVHHFTYGAFNPVASYLLAFLGSFLGLICTQRARAARSRQRRTRWLVIAAFAIGGAATRSGTTCG
jgi:hypothetical protein